MKSNEKKALIEIVLESAYDKELIERETGIELSFWENDYNNNVEISQDVITRILDLLGVSYAELLLRAADIASDEDCFLKLSKGCRNKANVIYACQQYENDLRIIKSNKIQKQKLRYLRVVKQQGDNPGLIRVYVLPIPNVRSNSVEQLYYSVFNYYSARRRRNVPEEIRPMIQYALTTLNCRGVVSEDRFYRYHCENYNTILSLLRQFRLHNVNTQDEVFNADIQYLSKFRELYDARDLPPVEETVPRILEITLRWWDSLKEHSFAHRCVWSCAHYINWSDDPQERVEVIDLALNIFEN